IRYDLVTGVQTCALPISESAGIVAVRRNVFFNDFNRLVEPPDAPPDADLLLHQIDSRERAGLPYIQCRRDGAAVAARPIGAIRKIGRASCRERVESYGWA